MTIWGNHSASQYPDIFHAEIDGKPAAEVVSDRAWLTDDFIPTVQEARRGRESRTRGASWPAASAAQRRHRPRARLGSSRHAGRGDWVSMGASRPTGLLRRGPEGHHRRGAARPTTSGGKYSVVQGLDPWTRANSSRGRRRTRPSRSWKSRSATAVSGPRADLTSPQRPPDGLRSSANSSSRSASTTAFALLRRRRPTWRRSRRRWLRFRDPHAATASSQGGRADRLSPDVAITRPPSPWRTRDRALKAEPAQRVRRTCQLSRRRSPPLGAHAHVRGAPWRQLIADRVDYRMPFGVLGSVAHRLLIGRDLPARSSHYRPATALARLLSGSPRSPRARLPWKPMPPFRLHGLVRARPETSRGAIRAHRRAAR